MSHNSSPAVAALLRRWRDHRAVIADTQERQGRCDATFSLIDTGSLAQRSEALIALTNPCLLSRESVICPFDEVAALAGSLCGHLNENSDKQLVTAVIAGLLVGEEQLLGPSSKFQTDPAYFRDHVLLKLGGLATSDMDVDMLMQLLLLYQPSRKDVLPTIKPQLQTHAMVDNFFFKLAPLVKSVATVAVLVRMVTLMFGQLPVDTRAELLWKPEIREFFAPLTAIVLRCKPQLLPDGKSALSDMLAMSMMTVAYHADESLKPCPLWNDREWYRTVLFPLLRMKHPRDLPVVFTAGRPQFPFFAQADFYLTEEFRDGVLLPHISRKMSFEKVEVMLNVFSKMAHNCRASVALKQVFVNTKSYTRLFGPMIKRIHDRLRAAELQKTKVPESPSLLLFGFLTSLVGVSSVIDHNQEWSKGIEVPVWSTRVFFDEILVPYLSVLQSEQVSPDLFCEVVFAFWMRRPVGVTVEELRDKIIFPLAKIKYSGVRVDVLSLMSLLLKRAEDDSPENRAFKDAFATRESEVMYLRGSDPNDANRSNADRFVVFCLFCLIQDGAVLNGRRADAVADLCLRLKDVTVWLDFVSVVKRLMSQAPNEDDEAVVCRQAKLLDAVGVFTYLNRLSVGDVDGTATDEWILSSKRFFFTALRRRIHSAAVAVRQGFTQLLPMMSVHENFCAAVAHVSCSTDAAMYLETLCFLVPVGGGGFLTAEDVAVLAPLCSTAASAAAMARLIDHLSQG